MWVKVKWLIASALTSLVAAALIIGGALAPEAMAAKPINIAIISGTSALVGKSVVYGAELAAKQINEKGGINGRPIKLFIYDDHLKSTDAVEAFQRAVYRHHVAAVVGNWISEIALSLEPWAARLHTIYIITGAASPKITRLVHREYNRYKYVFQLKYNAIEMAKTVCALVHQDLVKKLGYKTAYVVSENAAWTLPLDNEYLKCLPKAGLKVYGHLRFAPNTNDFTPIFSKIEKYKPDVLIIGWSHAALKATVQWHEQHIPAPLVGVNAQATASDFWQKTNGATNWVVTQAEGSPAPITPKTIPFVKAYKKMFHTLPAYAGYTTYDAIYVLKNAIEKSKSTNPNKLVKALEKTNYVGVMGHIEFYSKSEPFTHGIKWGKGYATGVMLQWQNGKLVTIWPADAATGKLSLPSKK